MIIKDLVPKGGLTVVFMDTALNNSLPYEYVVDMNGVCFEFSRETNMIISQAREDVWELFPSRIVLTTDAGTRPSSSWSAARR